MQIQVGFTVEMTPNFIGYFINRRKEKCGIGIRTKIQEYDLTLLWRKDTTRKINDF